MYNDYEFYKFPSEWATIGRSENIQVEYVSQSIDATKRINYQNWINQKERNVL